MSLTIDDIKRAIWCGGDISAFSEVWRQALGNPPIPIIDSLEVSLELPETTVLLKHIDHNFKEAMAARADKPHHRLSPKAEIDLTVVGLAPFGDNIGSYLEHVINQVKPDIIAIDTPPLVLSASMLYAFSIPCAVGLPAYGEIMSKNSGQFYASETFYPGNMNETAIIKSWLGRIPLFPAGVPQPPMTPDSGSRRWHVDETYVDQLAWKSNLLTAYRILDESLNGVSSLQEGTKITRDICLSLVQNTSSKMREVVIEDACYIVSRVMEIAGCANTVARKARLLAIVDIAHYADIEYIANLLGRGVTDKIYVPPKSYARATDVVLVGKNRDNLKEEAEKYKPKSTLTQKLFRNEFDRLIEVKDSETLSDSEAYRLIAEITSQTRAHPDIARGVSVRGAIAFEGILQSLSEMRGGLTRETIRKAALITLPPRISLKQKGDEAAIVSDIVKEVLYSIHFSGRGKETALSGVSEWLSTGDVMESLNKLEPISSAQHRGLTQKRPPTIVADTGKNRERLKYLESLNFLKKEQRNQYSLTRKALEYLLDELEQKLKAGEITPEEYSREKARLMELFENTLAPRFKMSARELATTILEIIDAQDKQWSSEVSFETMHLYYHIKANSGEAELSPEKRDYYKLKMLIDDLEKQAILRTTEKASGFILTGTALNMLLKYLIDKNSTGKQLRDVTDVGKTLAHERSHEIRRYTQSDVFRDISIRHTLKEIARQKKDLASVRSSDFRVFLKQPLKSQSDIVLCLDTSGSMHFRYKLMYARLAAAGLVQAAVANRDRIGMIAFSDYGQVTVPLTDQDPDTIIGGIARLNARGNTNIGDGIKCSSQLLFQNYSQNQKYIILITDGQPTAISERIFAQLKLLKEKDLTEESALLETRQAVARGIRVSVIHIAGRDEASGELVRNIARVGKGKVRRISGADDLKAILHQ